jgi:hypothetical protein
VAGNNIKPVNTYIVNTTMKNKPLKCFCTVYENEEEMLALSFIHKVMFIIKYCKTPQRPPGGTAFYTCMAVLLSYFQENVLQG